MRKIDNKLSISDTDVIFNSCNSFSPGDTSKIVSKYKGTILNESKNYDEYTPKHLNLYPLTQFGTSEINEIKKLYEDKLTNKKHNARRYYDILVSNAEKCPICGHGTPLELDHFVPKTLFPQLCITPSNLVPICHTCNFKKGEYFSKNYLEMPLHPYFDDIGEIWLECDITFDPTDVNRFRFHCDHCTSPLAKKYRNHLDVYHFDDVVQGSCCSEISDAKLCHKELLDADRNQLLFDIQLRRRSFEAADLNSWRSALYRGLERQFDEYCEYLNKR